MESQTTRTIEDKLYEIKIENNNPGYIYVDQAPSMKNVFDFAVVFSDDLEILNSKVLIYREQHERQIGSKRWLKQFFGMTPSSRPELGKDIDGISGATISVSSMTNAINELLVDVEYLSSKGIFSND